MFYLRFKQLFKVDLLKCFSTNPHFCDICLLYTFKKFMFVVLLRFHAEQTSQY